MKAQQTILTKMLKRIFVCCFAVARFNRSARSQGLRRRVHARSTRISEFRFGCTVIRVIAPRRYARFEIRGHSTYESSHSRINNVRRRTKILSSTALSRAKQTDKQPRLPEKIKFGSLAPMNIRWSRGIQNDQRHHIAIVNDTHSSR